MRPGVSVLCATRQSEPRYQWDYLHSPAKCFLWAGYLRLAMIVVGGLKVNMHWKPTN